MNLKKNIVTARLTISMSVTRSRLLTSICLLAVGLQSVLAEPQFPVLQTTATGAAPHGIRFARGKILVAAAGDDRIEIFDLASLEKLAQWPVANAPLDLIALGDDWLVAPFGADQLLALDGTSGAIVGRWDAGKGPSLFAPRLTAGKAYIVSEFADRLSVFDTHSRQVVQTYATGKRPYPADVSRDGVLAFVPNRGENTVSIIDLLNQKELARTAVCEQPEGGSLTADEVSYLVACGGDNRVMWINTASFEVTRTLAEGVGPRPFSVVVSADGRWGFVNNAGGNTVSVIDMNTQQVVTAIEVGEQPIVMRQHDQRLYVTSEVSNTLAVIGIPQKAQKSPATQKTQVLVLGMIHTRHRDSERYSLDTLQAVAEAFKPDFWLAEIPPNRVHKAIATFAADSMLKEARVQRFPEYVDVMFPLSRKLPFEIIGAAAWNEPMANYRRSALKKIEADPQRASEWRQYLDANQIMEKALDGRDDDPVFIHSDAYDAIIKQGLEPYDRLFNDELGPGGWRNINAAHYRLLARALDEHRGEGKRFLITFGAAHKYWFLEKLRQREDLELLDAQSFFIAMGEKPEH